MNMIAQNTEKVNGENKFLFADFILKSKQHAKELTRESIVETIQMYDDLYFKSKLWKDEFINHGFVNRVLITQVGEIKFKRRYYIAKDKQKNSNFFFIDSLFSLSKYSRLTDDAKQALVVLTSKNNASYAADNALWDTVVSRQTVSNILRELQTVKDDMPVIPEIMERYNQSVKTLYLEMDEAHCNLQARRNIVANLALIHTGHSKSNYACKRKQLENKHYLGGLNVNTTVFIDRIYDYISRRYNPKELKYVFISGDGAKWINSVSQKLKRCLSAHNIKVIQVLDKFHLRKRLTSIFSANNKMINYLLKNFTEITEDSFRLIADTFYKNKQEHKCNEQKFKNHVNYICNNYDFIKNLKHPEYKTSCSMEGHISHVLASKLTSRPKGFSKDTLETMVQLLILKANMHELSIEDLYAWRNHKATESAKSKKKTTHKRYKRIYDITVPLELTKSNNTKMKDFIKSLVSPKWFYS
ncbi:MAG: ISLre2 family transposase [Acidimicrobiia bacterium]